MAVILINKISLNKISLQIPDEDSSNPIHLNAPQAWSDFIH